MIQFKSIFTAATMLLAWGASAQCEFTELTLETTTGEWGAEVSWELYHVMESGDELVASFQGVDDGVTSSETLCLEDGATICSRWTLGETVGTGQKLRARLRFPVLPCPSPCLTTATASTPLNWAMSAVRWSWKVVRNGMH